MGAISGCGAGGGDPCDAIMAGTVRFDLRPLAQACRRAYQSASGTIALRLADAPMLTYEF